MLLPQIPNSGIPPVSDYPYNTLLVQNMDGAYLVATNLPEPGCAICGRSPMENAYGDPFNTLLDQNPNVEIMQGMNNGMIPVNNNTSELLSTLPHWEIMDIKSGTQEFDSRLHSTNSPSLRLHLSEMSLTLLVTSIHPMPKRRNTRGYSFKKLGFSDFWQNINRKVTPDEVERVKNMIEQCLMHYMNKKEVIDILYQQQQIEPDFTKIVWQTLEEQNQDFFKAYYPRLILKEQITKFNNLLRQQAAVINQLKNRHEVVVPSGQSYIPPSKL
ncbi:ribonuclease H-like domain-containing protein [Tanacetum coccineum]